MIDRRFFDRSSRAVARALEARPWLALPPLVLAQWAAVGIFVAVVRHNGWLFYQGGDQSYYWGSAWVTSTGALPPSVIGFGWSYLLSPLALATGSNFLDGLPGIVLVQTLVLLPLALACILELSRRLIGPLLAPVAGALWIAAPFLLVPLFDGRYHARYVEQFLPQALGLTGLGDFPSLVCLLVAAVFAFRLLDGGDRIAAAGLGLATGFAIGIKPSNVLFVAAPVLALAVARRWRDVGLAALATLPALVALAIWKQRGLGNLPLLSLGTAHVAAALGGPLPLATFRLGKYVELDWAHLGQNFVALGEFFWSVRVVEWIGVAGIVGAARRAPAKAVFLVAWLSSFLLLKGTSHQASLESGSFFRLLMPSYPAWFLLAISIVLLVPRLAPRLRRSEPAGAASDRRRLAVVGGVAALTGVVPALLFLGLPQMKDARVATDPVSGTLLPIRPLDLRASTRGHSVRLTWRPVTAPGVASFYRIYRTRGGDGIRCDDVAAASASCSFAGDLVGVSKAPEWSEAMPPGRWSYRVAPAANWRDDTSLGDPLLLSGPAETAHR